jgi:predicted Zn-ribbon and HTH transcriptional regulator
MAEGRGRTPEVSAMTEWIPRQRFKPSTFRIRRSIIHETKAQSHRSISSADNGGHVSLQPLACCDCGFEYCRGTGMPVSCKCGVLSVEVSGSEWSLVQRSPTVCGVSEWDGKVSIMRVALGVVAPRALAVRMETVSFRTASSTHTQAFLCRHSTDYMDWLHWTICIL